MPPQIQSHLSGSSSAYHASTPGNNSILKQLVLQAKKEYEAEAVHRIQIYFAGSHGCWRWTDSRHKRPMSSIVLNPGVKEMLLSDTKDFLKSEKVCAVLRREAGQKWRQHAP